MHRLTLQSLTKSYDGHKVVDDVSMEVRSGEVVGLLGPNGAGKTSTFFMVLGLLQPDAGKIYLDGEDISLLPIYRRARLGLQYLPQEPSVFRKMTVEGNVLAILETLRLSSADRARRLEELPPGARAFVIAEVDDAARVSALYERAYARPARSDAVERRDEEAQEERPERRHAHLAHTRRHAEAHQQK